MTLLKSPEGRLVEVLQVAPTPQVSTASDVVVTGSEMDVRAFQSLVYTVLVATNGVTWTVFGANAADYSDEVAVNGPTGVAAGAAGSYAVSQTPYAHYRVKIRDTVGGSHGTATVRGIAKH